MFSSRLEFKGAVIGTLLGDASLPKIHRGINTHLSVTHSAKQSEYLDYKRSLLEYLTGCRVYQFKAKAFDKEYPSIRLDTKTHPLYTKLREHIYIDGRKTVDEHVMKCLTPLGLALWYQDDGCLTDHSDFLTPFLCTHGYSKAEVELMARMLQKQFGLQWRLRKDKQYYALRLRRCDRSAFFELIRPYVCPSMEYKIRDDGREVDPMRGQLITKQCQYCEKDFDVMNQKRHRLFCSCQCYHDSRKKRMEPQAKA